MRKISLIASVGMLSFTLGSCSLIPGLGGSSESTSQQPTPGQPEVSPSPTQPEPGKENFPEPTQPGKPKPPVASGLIPPTNPDKRIGEIAKGRTDPFNLIPVQPKITIEVDKTANNRPVPPIIPIPQPPANTNPPNPSNGPQPGAIPVGTNPPNGIPTLPNNGQPNGVRPPFIPELPPLPQPNLAKAVTVTGVISINGEVHAIVKAPNENSSRYVKAGQYLSNGQVLVKRIEMNAASTPVVVLEQYGVEVSRAVGDTVEIASNPETPIVTP